MGGNQSQQGVRKRDAFLNMCKQGSNELLSRSKRSLTRTLSESIKLSSRDIISSLCQHQFCNQPVNLMQYVFTFMTIEETLAMKLVNKNLRWQVEISSHIYANKLSQIYLRKLSLNAFVEYGSDQNFVRMFQNTLLSVELAPDQQWQVIYKQLLKANYQIRHFEEKMEENYNYSFGLSDSITRAISEPSLPISILTGDILKNFSNTWFQLNMTQFSPIRNSKLDNVISILEQDCVSEFNNQVGDLELQLLLELRFVILDNFVKEPQELQVPHLLRFLVQLYHMIYLRCVFSRNVLIVMSQNQDPCQLLSLYVLLWKSYIGSLFDLSQIYSQLMISFNRVFRTFYDTDSPDMNLQGVMGRIWAQTVLQGGTNNNDQLSETLLQSFYVILLEKRSNLLYCITNEKTDRKSFYRQNEYFRHSGGGIDCLLSHFTSSILDVSINEHSSNWLGHSNMKIGSHYGALIEKINLISTNLYTEGSYLLSGDYERFKEYIEHDLTYLEEIINKWTISICIKPMAFYFLQDKIKINLRGLVLDQNSEQENNEQNLESMIIQEKTELQKRIEDAQDPLFNLIAVISKEEKLQVQQQQQVQLVQSFIEEPSKISKVSTYTNSTRASSISRLTSQFSCFSSSRQQTIYTNDKFIGQIHNRLQNTIWNQRLRTLQKSEIGNQLQIEDRDRTIQMRNLFQQVPEALPETVENALHMNYITSIETISHLCSNKTQSLSFEQNTQQTDFIQVPINANTLAGSFEKLWE